MGNPGPGSHSRRKPPFNLILGSATLTTPPPFEFTEVVLRNFPLKANFRALARFCDKYLNLAPEFAYFRPAVPFVILSIVNYGKMSMEAGNLGWTSQNEVLFSVPLEWYERDERGRLVFRDLAQVSPFIFIDDEDSQVEGREVYGWPKVQGWFSASVDPWTRHPLNRRELLSLGANVFDKMFADNRPQPREILAIEEDAPPTFSVLPPQAENILNPWISIPKAITGWSGILATIAEMATSPAFRGYGSVDRKGRSNLLERIAENLDLFTRTLHANTVNLKQMRDAADPQQICYQALTNAKMAISQFRRGGMLGDLALLRGDPTGGFRIHVREYPDQPIVETLGLRVADRVEGSVPAAILKPVMPFWQELDLTYLKGENICWRTNSKTIGWRNQERVGRPPVTGPEGATNLLYNTTGSNGFQVATGPFRFPEATLRVLPLPADPEKLKAFVDGHLNLEASPYYFEPWGNYVYMVVTAYAGMSSESADFGNWASRQVDFAVPVRWFDKDKKDKSLVSVGFVSPFTFMDSDIGTTTAREANGWAARKAQITALESSWLGTQGPFADISPLMELKTKVLPALNLGQQTELRTIIEVVRGNPASSNDHVTWSYIADSWGRPLKAELEQMASMEASNEFAGLRALELEILANRAPVNQFSLKQFRDAEEPNSACYQALVRTSLVIDRIWEIREIENQTHIRIFSCPTLPIVDMLGLRVQCRMLTDQGEVECLQPMRPFFMKVDLRSGPAENIWSTDHYHQWEKRDESSPKGYFEIDPDAKTFVGTDLVKELDKSERADIANRVHAHAFRGPLLTRAEAANIVLDPRLQPQMAVHAMLSNGWGNWNGISETVGKLPTFVIRRDSVGLGDQGAAPELFPVDRNNLYIDADPYESPYWTPGKWRPAGLPSDITAESYSTASKALFWRRMQSLAKTKGFDFVALAKEMLSTENPGESDPKSPSSGKKPGSA